MKIGCYGSWNFPNIRGVPWRPLQYCLNATEHEVRFFDLYSDKTQMVREMSEFSPDLLFINQIEPLKYLKFIRKYAKKCILWLPEWYPINNFPINVDIDGEIDYIFMNGEGLLEEYKRAWNIKYGKFVEQGCDHEAILNKATILKNIENQDRKYDIIFIGSIHAGSLVHERRNQILNYVYNNFNLKVIDPCGDNTKIIDSTRLMSAYSESKIALGISVKNDIYKYSSDRLYLAMGFGATYLCEYFPGINDIFEVNTHLMVFSNLKELSNNITLLLNNSELRKKIAYAGYIKVTKDYNYIIEVNTILNEVKDKLNLS